MPYHRPEDQYRRNRSREMIEELKQLNEKPKCIFTTIKNYRQLEFQGHPHAGTLCHICVLDKGHLGNCKCVCDVEFQGF